jgi:hypothetical protein
MYGVETEKQPAEQNGQRLPKGPFGLKEGARSSHDIGNDNGEMPRRRLVAKYHVIDPQPEEEKRAVFIPQKD